MLLCTRDLASSEDHPDSTPARAASTLGAEEVLDSASRLVRDARRRRGVELQLRRDARVDSAVHQLVQTARPELGSVRFDAPLFLKSVTRTSKKYIELHVSDDQRSYSGAVARARLLECRRALIHFCDLEAVLTPQGLRFSWRGGRGRLVLYPRQIAPGDRGKTLHVVFSRSPASASAFSAIHATTPSRT